MVRTSEQFPEKVIIVFGRSIDRMATVFAFQIAFSLIFVAGCNVEKPVENSFELAAVGENTSSQETPPLIRGVLLRADAVTSESVGSYADRGLTVALAIEGGANGRVTQAERTAASTILNLGQPIEYWIEIARCPTLADEHPEWMCSLQGHDEWRRLFPDVAQEGDKSVVKTYPWVPILYEEAFAAHRDRIQNLLADLPAPSRLWLNDLQSGPSACGCGHPLCRWAADYGPKKTATFKGDQAAADFVRAIQERNPKAEIVPIWTTECEEEDEHETCGGVGCFDGICWEAYTRQLMALERVAPRIGVQCYFKAFHRDLPRYGQRAGWVRFALESFQNMPPRRNGKAIPANRLVAVLQGWGVTDDEIQAQIAMADSSKAKGYLVATFPIDQSWAPRLWDLRTSKMRAGDRPNTLGVPK